MSITLDYDSNNWIKSQSGTVELELRKRQKRIAEILGYDICISFIFNENRNMVFTKSIYAKDDKYLNGKLPNTIFIKKHSYSTLNDLLIEKDIVENHIRYGNTMMLEKMESEVFIPLFNSNGNTMVLIGCLYLGSCEYKKLPSNILSKEWVINDQISDISKLLALALVKLEQVSNAVSMIHIFTEVLKHKDHFLPNHSYNVANWCREIGMELGLTREELNKLYIAGLLHDVGKVMIDYDILNKPNELTEDQWEIMKNHSVDSYVISKHLLGHILELNDIPKMVRHHHERYDGEGYPDGLKGNEVPLNSYIIGISDAVDAMMSKRPYKKALPINGVVSQLYKNKGTQFHPKLVDIMVDKLTKAHQQFEKNLHDTINLSSLIINFKENILILEGSLIKIENYYIFKPSEESKTEDLDLSQATDIEMVVKDINNISHYQVKVEDFSNNTFYISSLQLIPALNTFNLLWNLDGILFIPNMNRRIQVEIIRIGGGALSFCLYEDLAYKVPYEKPLKIKVLFDNHTIEITGSIIKVYDFGPYKYFDFFYTDIPDSKRDMIFRELFKKQIELRKAIAEYKY